MTFPRRPITWLAVFWMIIAMGYAWAAWQQEERVNLSPAAGGQMPYLKYAQGMAQEGLTDYFGDRNRLPLYPALLSLVYNEDWDTFVERSMWFAIVCSMVVLIGIGWAAYATLPRWPATAFTLAAAVCVFIHKSSFVQAELLYYGLLFASWLLLCRTIRRSTGWGALPAGALLGLTYLTKASAAATLVAFITVTLFHAILLTLCARGKEPCNHDRPRLVRSRDVLLSGLMVVAGFLAVAYPYLSNNNTRFGRYFYNVNSTFFMWCDGWEQAKTFADTYHISEQFPQAPPDQIPRPANYWKTHTARQMLGRLRYGFGALSSLALQGPYLKYLVLAAAFCVVLGIRQRRSLPRLAVTDWVVTLFCVLFFGGYALSYAWYAQVAYGDRFLLSLFLPAMFTALWLGRRLARRTHPFALFGKRVPVDHVLGMALTILLLGEGVTTATTSLYRPTRAFVQFYYNESRELQAAGDLREAAKGLKGVISLDPNFAPAHLGLGMIALNTGRIDEALASLTTAARLSPQDADIHNSLGAALVQADRVADAIDQFRQATELDPQLAVAWYNLGGSYYRLGLVEEARNIHRRLHELDPGLAAQLAELLGN